MANKQVRQPQTSLIDRAGEYIMRGRREAITLAVLSSLLPYIGWIGIVILCLVTLRKGVKEGFLVLIAITVPSIVVGGLVLKNYQVLLQSVLFGSVLTWFLAVVLRKTVSWQAVLNVVALMGMAGVLVFHLFVPNTQQYWLDFLQSVLGSSGGAITRLNIDQAALSGLVQSIAASFTGIQATILLFNGVLNLLIARWLQARLYNPGGFAQELRNIRLNWFLAILLLVVFLVAMIKLNIAQDLLPVILLPYAVIGLSLVHYMANKVKFAWFALIGFYLLLIFLFPYMLALLILAVLVDLGLNFRKRVQA